LRGPRFVLRDEVELLSTPPEPSASVAFLPPMDSLMWDRSLLQPLFDFDWVWEVFTPEHKRQWGYYVLPILFRDRLVRRDRAADRRRRRLRARARALVGGRLSAWSRRGFVDAMRVALGAYLRFAGADRLEWAPHLDKEKRLFPSRP